MSKSESEDYLIWLIPIFGLCLLLGLYLVIKGLRGELPFSISVWGLIILAPAVLGLITIIIAVTYDPSDNPEGDKDG